MKLIYGVLISWLLALLIGVYFMGRVDQSRADDRALFTLDSMNAQAPCVQRPTQSEAPKPRGTLIL
jgi:hypothetical protein